MSLGLSQAGMRVIAACELDLWAADTYRANHGSVRLHRCDIRDLSDEMLESEYRGRVSVVVGGPPCQGFSVSGARQYGIFSEKNRLLMEFIRVVRAIQPRFFILENVRGLASASLDGRRHALHVLLSELEASGYKIHHDVLQAADYGLPQYRSRLFVVGGKDISSWEPFPGPTHGPEAQPGLQRHRSAADAISDLNPIRAGEGSDSWQPYLLEPTDPYQVALRGDGSGTWNHQAMSHTPRIVARFHATPAGGKGYEVGRTRELLTPPVTVYKMNNQRLLPDRPSLCITANFQSNYIHPLADRNLTAREAARIQGFPDSFVFRGRRTLMSSTLLAREGRHAENHLSQYNQIGNAVPPALAKVVGQWIVALAASEHSRLDSVSEAERIA